MSSARFKRLTYDAALNNDPTGMREAFNDWQVANCYHPTRQLVYDAHTQTKRFIECACGRCYHCLETKINEWCTRMYAHAEDFKRVYFVTLTYRSISNPNIPANKLLLSKLSGALWHRDSKNSTYHLSYNPCVLVKSHYQNFLKRLRKNTGINDLTYVLSGEYGSQYGRPHFHLILFTNQEIKRDDIVRAWSVALWHDDCGQWAFRTSQKLHGVAYDFPIGHIDFHDLVTNGTFNTTAKIRIDGTYMNAAQCFAYVCKYVCKRDDANLKRIAYSYNAMYHKQEFVRHYNDEIPCEIAAKYLKDAGYDYSIEDIYNLKKLKYEKIVYSPTDRLYTDGLKTTFRKNVCGKIVDMQTYPEIYYEFRDLFRPFCEFSRGTPIGSVYAKRNIQEFKEGVFTKPILQDAGFVVPNYFRRKASDHLYGLRVCRKTFTGSHYVYGALVNLLGRFTKCVSDNVPPSEHFYSSDPRFSIDSALQNCFQHFADFSTGERVVLCDNLAQHFKYDRHQRKYLPTRIVPLSDWLRSWCVSLQDELHRHDVALAKSEYNNAMKDDAMLLLHEMLDDASELKHTFVKRQKAYLSHKQEIYLSIHKNVE